MGVEEMRLIGQFIAEVLQEAENAARLTQVSAKVRELCRAFPLYPERLARRPERA
jgi:glycine/serine hydroxymethyltransferase